MIPILLAAGVVGAMGLIFGGALAYASRIFAVEKDPRIDEIKEFLPGANCGGCGFPGCDALAAAIAAGDAPVNSCPVGGMAVAAKVAEVMGVVAGETVALVAALRCGGCKDTGAVYKFEYTGAKDCRAALSTQGGDKACEYSCLGYGTCVNVCNFGALKIGGNGLPVVDTDKCTSCGACVKVCPKAALELRPKTGGVDVLCRNTDKAKSVRAVCKVGCIACGICEKNCLFGAIFVKDNLAVVDYEKCRQCLICVEKCPQKIIDARIPKRKLAVIDAETCIGCGICKKNCVKEAIEGKLKKPHTADPEKCIGCSVCADKCPKDSIAMQ